MLRLLTLLGKQAIASLLWEAGASRFVDGKVITGNTAALNTIADIEILKKYIFNIYRTMMLRGIKGTYLYICNPELRAYFSNFIETE
jgi:DUF2075 family protein